MASNRSKPRGPKPRGPGSRSRSLSDVLAEAFAEFRKEATPAAAPIMASPEEAWRELVSLRSLGVPPTMH